jgi:putative two-component system response regulator
MARFLVVDDEPDIRELLTRTIRDVFRLGEVDAAVGPMEAVEYLFTREYDVLLTDLRMGEADAGFELLERVRAMVEDKTPVIVVTGFGEDPVRMRRAMKLGALDFVAKPWATQDLREALGVALGRREEFLARRAAEAARRQRTERDGLREVVRSQEAAIRSLAQAVEGHDDIQGGHVQRLRHNCAILARGFPEFADAGRLRDLLYGAVLHDIGKVGVDTGILSKQGPLTPDELREMRKHPEHGVRIVRTVDFLVGASEVIHCHHEKWDGSGYPRRLSREAIPLSARIFMLADAFDAITAKRPYQPALPREEAIRRIRASTGTHFDPDVVRVFERCRGDLVIEGEDLPEVAYTPAPRDAAALLE